MRRGFSQRLQEVQAGLRLLRGLADLLRKRSQELGLKRKSLDRLTTQVDRLSSSTARAEAQCEFLQTCSENEWGPAATDLDKLLSERDEINHRLLKVVDDATHNWGVKVTRIEIKDIEPPRDLVDSMARQMKAERDKRAAILVAEGSRQAAILSAEGEKQAQILAAEGRREAAYRDAEAREREAEAEAKATTMVSQAIEKGSVQAINYFVADKYVGALKALAEAKNQKVLILPLESSSVIGAIAGVGEIAREAFGNSSQAEDPNPQGGQRGRGGSVPTA